MSNPANTTHAAYDQGLGRAASPADSIGTKYAEDQTTYSEDEMDSETFERRVMQQIRLDQPRPQEEAIRSPLIPRPPEIKECASQFLLYLRSLTYPLLDSSSTAELQRPLAARTKTSRRRRL